MALVAWIVSVGAFLGGLAAQSDLPSLRGAIIAQGLFAIAVLACPVIWDNIYMRALLAGKERAMTCVALVLALPLLLLG